MARYGCALRAIYLYTCLKIATDAQNPGEEFCAPRQYCEKNARATAGANRRRIKSVDDLCRLRSSIWESETGLFLFRRKRRRAAPGEETRRSAAALRNTRSRRQITLGTG